MWLYEEFKKSLKRGLIACTRCNWPELSRYCGCCELSTGIYIRCVLTVVATTVTTIFHGFMLMSILHARAKIRNADVSALEEFLEDTDSVQTDIDGIYMIMDGVVYYLILWNLFQVFYVIRNIWTVYVVYKKKCSAVKVLLYIGVPCWIFDGFLSIITTLLFSYLIKGMLFFNFMFEGYNLLAIHSKYKELSGKSRRVQDFGRSPEIIRPHIINESSPVDPESQPHCITCQCFVRHEENNCPYGNNDVDSLGATPVSAVPTIAEMRSASTPTEAGYSNDSKSEDTLNFKDSPIIYNQDILHNADSVAIQARPINEESSFENGLRDRPQRPTTLSIRPIVVEEKTDLCDTAVIYDERQFNVGTSPVVERV